MEKYYVCIDIGGTAIKHGVADVQGNFLIKNSCATLAKEDGGLGIVHKVIAIVKYYQASYEVAGVAIATAGIVEIGAAGKIVFAGADSFPGYSGIELGRLVAENCQVLCKVMNDVNAAALGEYWLGSAQNAKLAFVMAVGTGVGGCILLDGKVLSGASYSAGEIGFIRLHGEQRIFEEIASTQAMINEAAASHNMSPAELEGQTVFEWARAGDVDAVIAIEHMIDALAEGLANVCCLLNPDLIVLGGAVMAQEKYLRPRIEQRLEDLVVLNMRVNTKIAFAKLGNDAAMLGALYNLLQN